MPVLIMRAGAKAQAAQAAAANGDAKPQEEPDAPGGMTPLEEARMLFAQRQAREAARQVCMRACDTAKKAVVHMLLWCFYPRRTHLTHASRDGQQGEVMFLCRCNEGSE